MTDTMLHEDTRLDTQTGEHDKFSHIVYPASDLTEAYIMGNPVTALCGFVFVPTLNPDRYPVCPTCKEAFDAFAGQRGWTPWGSEEP